MSGQLGTRDEPMSREELDTFTRKLEEFTDSLTPKERSLLLAVLIRADVTEGDDVEAHALGNIQLAAAALALRSHRVRFPPEA